MTPVDYAKIELVELGFVFSTVDLCGEVIEVASMFVDEYKVEFVFYVDGIYVEFYNRNDVECKSQLYAIDRDLEFEQHTAIEPEELRDCAQLAIIYAEMYGFDT